MYMRDWLVSWFHRDFNVGIFSDTINVVNVKLCMMVVLIALYLFIPFSVTLTIFQGHSCVKQFWLKILYYIRLSWNFIGLLSMSSRSWIYHLFWWLHVFSGDNWHIYSFACFFLFSFYFLIVIFLSLCCFFFFFFFYFFFFSCVPHFSVIVKHFELLKVLYKFPLLLFEKLLLLAFS